MSDDDYLIPRIEARQRENAERKFRWIDLKPCDHKLTRMLAKVFEQIEELKR